MKHWAEQPKSGLDNKADFVAATVVPFVPRFGMGMTVKLSNAIGKSMYRFTNWLYGPQYYSKAMVDYLRPRLVLGSRDQVALQQCRMALKNHVDQLDLHWSHAGPLIPGSLYMAMVPTDDEVRLAREVLNPRFDTRYSAMINPGGDFMTGRDHLYAVAGFLMRSSGKISVLTLVVLNRARILELLRELPVLTCHYWKSIHIRGVALTSMMLLSDVTLFLFEAVVRTFSNIWVSVVVMLPTRSVLWISSHLVKLSKAVLQG